MEMQISPLHNWKESATIDKASYESVNSAIQAYATMPFVSSLIRAFVTSQNPPCQSCTNSNIVSSVALINSICVASSLSAIVTSLLIIYQASKLLSSNGPSAASKYLKETSSFRQIARNSAYFSLGSFVAGYGVCLAATVDTVAAWIASIILIGAGCFLIMWYNQTKAIFTRIHMESS